MVLRFVSVKLFSCVSKMDFDGDTTKNRFHACTSKSSRLKVFTVIRTIISNGLFCATVEATALHVIDFFKTAQETELYAASRSLSLFVGSECLLVHILQGVNCYL